MHCSTCTSPTLFSSSLYSRRLRYGYVDSYSGDVCIFRSRTEVGEVKDLAPLDIALYALLALLGIGALMTLGIALTVGVPEGSGGTITTVFGTLGAILTALITGSYFSREVRKETDIVVKKEEERQKVEAE